MKVKQSGHQTINSQTAPPLQNDVCHALRIAWSI